jgi:hypothetical protein
MSLWAQNRAKTAKTPAFTYFFDHAMPGEDAETFGAFHTADVPCFMSALAMSNRPFTAADSRSRVPRQLVPDRPPAAATREPRFPSHRAASLPQQASASNALWARQRSWRLSAADAPPAANGTT